MGTQPVRRKVERRRQRQHVRVGRHPKVRKARAGEREGSTDIDLLHQIEPLHREVFGFRNVEDARVVDHDADATEVLYRCSHCPCDVVVAPHVTDHGNGMTPKPVQLVHSRVDGSGQPGIRRIGLGEQHDVPAAARYRTGYGKSDTTAPAGHDCGSSPEVFVVQNESLSSSTVIVAADVAEGSPGTTTRRLPRYERLTAMTTSAEHQESLIPCPVRTTDQCGEPPTGRRIHHPPSTSTATFTSRNKPTQTIAGIGESLAN